MTERRERETFDHKDIEPKWQRKWEEDGLYHADIDPSKPKHYALTMLPYPSGDFHIGHWYAMTPSDARARYMRMKGYNVMFPMGFDAFGLPAENAAIKHGIHPKEWTYSNVERMREQLKSMGAMFDWRREAISSDPKYYHWTQWFFLKLYEAGLTYRKNAAVDWCPSCNTTLAREQVWGEDRVCERCGTPVLKKQLEQWFFRTTKYAEELLQFDQIDWPERVRTLQTNWIGRSEGASVIFKTEQGDELEVFTTRPDTLWGATFMVLAPEHPLVGKLTSADQKLVVDEYILQAARQSDIERESADKEKTGVFTGGYAINPVNDESIPIWIADYVLMSYGTGAIMAVPAHDERDFEFALRFGLPIIPVIEHPKRVTKSFVMADTMTEGFVEALAAAGIPYEQEFDNLYVTMVGDQAETYVELAKKYIRPGSWNEVVGTQWKFIFTDGALEWNSVKADQKILAKCKKLYLGVADKQTLMEMLWGMEFYRDVLFHAEYGMMVNSEEMNGTPAEKAVANTINFLEKKGTGEKAINYRLRDWLISRQRYWGAPIPMIHCKECGIVPVPMDQLPVELPDDIEWRPTGESPLKFHESWKNVACPKCGGEAERELDTMDTFMCSSWYHLRYLSPDYDNGPFDPVEYNYWMPVDVYTGGIEHANMHLIYTRFFHKALRDMSITEGHEPMLMLRNQGIVLGEDSEKMSKSRGNVVAPDDLVAQYGADTVRAYLMFFARWELGGPWNSQGIEGVVRWIRRVWTIFTEAVDNEVEASEDVLRGLRRKVHQTLKNVTHDFESFEFNTIISALMELMNEMYKARDAGAVGTQAWKEATDIYLRMLAPVAPHIAEELWELNGKPYSVHAQDWPQVDKEAAKEEEITLVVQVNGKLRDRITVPVGISDEEAERLALNSEVVQNYIAGKTVRKVIVVQGKLVNIVVG
jgi:leucyl-tRNA synthetase